MQISSIGYNTPHFQARIKIKKQGIENIAKDLVDTASLSSRSGATTLSTIGETTVFPSDVIADIGLSKTIHKQIKAIGNELQNISGRNIKTAYMDNEADLKIAEQVASVASSGSGLMTTGVGSYASAGASIIEPSAIYPSLGLEAIPQYVEAHAGETLNKLIDKGQGYSVLPSVSGALSQGLASEMLVRPGKIVRGETGMKAILNKKIPS